MEEKWLPKGTRMVAELLTRGYCRQWEGELEAGKWMGRGEGTTDDKAGSRQGNAILDPPLLLESSLAGFNSVNEQRKC